MVKYVYDAWGNHAVLNPDGTVNDSYSFIGNLNPYRYRGYYYDIETKLYYLKTRYYDPEVGRFITIDDLQYLDPETINGLNLYAYCANNPVMNVDENGNKWWKNLLGWVGTAIVLLGLTALTICTFGAAAPITGTAATLIVGATIGAFIGTGASIISQGIKNDWDYISGVQVFRDCFGGAVAGAISAIPTGGGFLGYIEAFGLGGLASVAGGVISGTVTDFTSAVRAFAIGGLASVFAKGISDGILAHKANKICNQSSKAKSLAVQKLQANPFNMGASAAKGSMRNAFKRVTVSVVKNLLKNASPFFRLGIYSSLISAGLSTLTYLFP